MSNPSNLVASLTNDLVYADRSGVGSFTGVDPIRFDDGLWLEEGTTNLVPNASLEAASLGSLIGVVNSGVTLTKVTSQSFVGAASVEVLTNGGIVNQGVYASTGPALGGTTARAFTASVHGRGSAFVELVTRAYYTDASTSESASSGALLTTAWPRRTQSHVTTAVKTLDFLTARFRISGGTPAATTFHADGFQIEEKAYATSLAVGDMGAGYAFTGTAHASTSTRAASSASVATAGHIDPTTGSLAFRFTRKIDTAGIEYLLICGTDGDDRLRIYVNDDDKLHVAWDTGSALPQYVASIGTIAVDTEYFVYTQWDGTIIGMSIDNGEMVVGVRDVPLGTFGTDPLTLQAT